MDVEEILSSQTGLSYKGSKTPLTAELLQIIRRSAIKVSYSCKYTARYSFNNTQKVPCRVTGNVYESSARAMGVTKVVPVTDCVIQDQGFVSVAKVNDDIKSGFIHAIKYCRMTDRVQYNRAYKELMNRITVDDPQRKKLEVSQLRERYPYNWTPPRYEFSIENYHCKNAEIQIAPSSHAIFAQELKVVGLRWIHFKQRAYQLFVVSLTVVAGLTLSWLMPLMIPTLMVQFQASIWTGLVEQLVMGISWAACFYSGFSYLEYSHKLFDYWSRELDQRLVAPATKLSQEIFDDVSYQIDDYMNTSQRRL
ncbi:hypothetical protein [Candidatus Synchoanobacter obligatus]|uniref:Uncharacterized protein n=1 Tax=Candidatus Synchoanobacter obligatus TaxID=2919597 RepID=A0ABT1L6D4_9GAMM|nr:hypothetical protein [Candidatus Synchoanobacter obligatus]MCP8352018.1 hypothetical protein [Candidatus Synchoanobacter obligatus]